MKFCPCPSKQHGQQHCVLENSFAVEFQATFSFQAMIESIFCFGRTLDYWKAQYFTCECQTDEGPKPQFFEFIQIILK